MTTYLNRLDGHPSDLEAGLKCLESHRVVSIEETKPFEEDIKAGRMIPVISENLKKLCDHRKLVSGSDIIKIKEQRISNSETTHLRISKTTRPIQEDQEHAERLKSDGYSDNGDRNNPQTQPGRNGEIVLSKTTKIVPESPVKNEKLAEYSDSTERRPPVQQTQSASKKSAIRISKTTEPIYDNYDVPLLQLSLTEDHRQGSHEKLLILQHTNGFKVILKTIVKENNKCFEEVLAMIYLQDVSASIYFILETREKIYVYMEYMIPGVTLKDLLMRIPEINPGILVKLFHFIIYSFIQNVIIVLEKKLSHNDLHEENILLVESNRWLGTGLIDFGNMKIKQDESYAVKDVMGIYLVVKHMIDRKYWTDILSLDNPPEIDFQLDEYKQMKEEHLSLEKIKGLQNIVLPLARNFANDPAANKYIIDMFKEKSNDPAANTSIIDMFKEKRRCIIQ